MRGTAFSGLVRVLVILPLCASSNIEFFEGL